MNRISKTVLIAGAIVLGTAGPAFATHDTPHFPDPCPGLHVQVYNDAGDHNFPEVGGHFICGPVKGDKGDTGETGPAGPAGEKGDKGDTGDTGATGETGSTGPQGDVGPAGPAGDTGPSGADGVDGKDGATGPAGLNGVDGAQGEKGDTGLTGNPGYSVCPDGSVVGMGVIPNCASIITDLPPTSTTVPQTPATTGTLPHTGSNATLFLAGAGLLLLLLGGALRFARR